MDGDGAVAEAQESTARGSGRVLMGHVGLQAIDGAKIAFGDEQQRAGRQLKCGKGPILAV